MNRKWLLIMLVVALLAFSITSSASLRAAAPDQSAFARATPESVGLSASDVQAIAARARELAEDEDTVGAEIMIVKNRKIVLHEAFGWRDIEDRQPMQRNTIFCIRSMTKPLVGAAVQMLIDEGKLSSSDRASKYLPAFDNDRSREITIDQLLAHTAGFPITLMNRAHTTYSGLREVADQAGTIGPSMKPGSGFSYSDADTETLAAIVAQVSGKPAEQFLQERLLDPLSMSETYCVLQKDRPRRDRVSSNYAGIPATWHKYWDDEAAPLFPYFLGAAAAYSTTTDYARFLAMLIDKGKVGTKRILSEAAVERAIKPIVAMRTPGTTNPYPTRLPGFRAFYGQHMMVYDDGNPRAADALPAFGHSGSDGTFAWAFPKHDLIVLYFTQARGGLSGFEIEAMLAPLIGLESEPQPNRLSVEKLKPYTGCYKYAEGAGAYAYVTLQGSRLAVDFSGGGMIVLRWSNAKGEWGDSQRFDRSLSFQTDMDGRVISMTVPEGKKEYVFKRLAAPDNIPTVDQLMVEIRSKHGNVAALRSVQLAGTLTVQSKVVGQVTQSAEGIERFRQEIVLSDGNDIIITANRQAWRKYVEGASYEKLDRLLAEENLLKNPFTRLEDWRRSFKSIEIIRKDRIGDEDVWVLRMKGGFLPALTRYVSVRTGLLLREDVWITAKGLGTFPRTNTYEDYRDIAGVRLPFRMITESPVTGKQVLQITDAKANPQLPAEMFSVSR